MKDLLLFIAVAGLLLAGGCGDGVSLPPKNESLAER
jgi:hypothetical protein